MRLGPQGLAILNGQHTYDEQSEWERRVPQQLDFVINELVNPSATTSASKVLSYMAYYYPMIKNEKNVELLTFSFLRCPIFFNDNKIVTLNDNYRIIEFFNYIVLYKYNISLPHLRFHKFYNSLLTGIKSFIRSDPNFHWKVVPLISGILSTIPMRTHSSVDEELTKLLGRALKISLNHDNTCMVNFEILSTNLLASSFVVECLPKGLHNYSIFLTDLIYLKKLKNGKFAPDLKWTDDPILKNLNRLSSLMNHFNRENFDGRQLNIMVDKIVWFSENLNGVEMTMTRDLEFLKIVTFTNVAIFESVIDSIMKSNNVALQISTSRRFLSIFSHLNFVIDNIGIGGFDAYNFIYYNSIETLLEKDPRALEISISTLMAKIDFNRVSHNAIQTSNLKFALNLLENVIIRLSPAYQVETLPLIKSFILTPENRFFDVGDESFKVIAESAHSVMLKFLDLKLLSPDDTTEYVRLLFDQYPSLLSLEQIIICFKRVLLNFAKEYDFLFTTLNEHIINCMPRITVQNQHLQTLRASFIYVQIVLLEFCPIEKFEAHLHWCRNLILQIDHNSDLEALQKALFEFIMTQCKVDTRKGELGIRFWYDEMEKGACHL